MKCHLSKIPTDIYVVIGSFLPFIEIYRARNISPDWAYCCRVLSISQSFEVLQEIAIEYDNIHVMNWYIYGGRPSQYTFKEIVFNCISPCENELLPSNITPKQTLNINELSILQLSSVRGRKVRMTRFSTYYLYLMIGYSCQACLDKEDIEWLLKLESDDPVISNLRRRRDGLCFYDFNIGEYHTKFGKKELLLLLKSIWGIIRTIDRKTLDMVLDLPHSEDS